MLLLSVTEMGTFSNTLLLRNFHRNITAITSKMLISQYMNSYELLVREYLVFVSHMRIVRCVSLCEVVSMATVTRCS